MFVGLDPIDLRWGFNRLTGLVAERLGRDARSGALFVFFGKRREALKVLFFDGTGVCLFYKRLDKGTFRIPIAAEGETLIAITDLRCHHPRTRGRTGLVQRVHGFSPGS